MGRMTTARRPDDHYLARLPDGTVKQVNPFTGTQVWTVPGRGNRPLGAPALAAAPVGEDERDRLCAFCPERYAETPPEKSRLVRTRAGQADPGWATLTGLSRTELHDTIAEFRRVPNLFEILSYDYWRLNHGVTLPAGARARRDTYLADPAGRAHVLAVARAKALAGGATAEAWELLDEAQRLAGTEAFFGGGHDVIVARRHLVDGATDTSALASSGTLTPEEHRAYVGFTVDAMADLYASNPHVRYVAAFQNWLKPAGASFDHLHKQLVAIDELGTQAEQEQERLRRHPTLYADAGPALAERAGLVVARTEHAVVYAGFGHRYPTLEVHSLSPQREPWRQQRHEVDAVADLLHALHAATGVHVPCNEEWHHTPTGVDLPLPWRIVLKWRVSTLAGFEGGTKIYVNTIDPWALRDRVVTRLHALADEGRLADGIRLSPPTRPDASHQA